VYLVNYSLRHSKAAHDDTIAEPEQ
jgi:hypothetical protein